MTYEIHRWDGTEPPRDSALEKSLADEGLSPSSWSNGPGDRYAEHSHTYHKVLYCLRGSITFIVEGTRVDLNRGDRLDLTPGTKHAAIVGPDGVTCVEAAR